MSAERYTTEKSTLNKKPEWGGALVGHHHHHHQHHQQHGHFLPQHQNLQQTQRPFAHHQLIGGRLDGMTFQPDAGVSRSEIAFKNPNANVDAHGVQQACHFNTVADSIMCCHDDDVGAAHTRPASALQERFGMPASDTSTHNKHKSSIGITGERHQASGIRDQVICAGKSDLSMSTSIKMPAPRRSRNTSMSPLTVRPTGTKDRHSKVRTAKGLRDRRVRLSAPTAIQFFDVQDRLGYDQPSKAVDWLIKKARAAIDELAPVEAVIAGGETTDVPARERKLSKDLHDGSLVKVKDEEQSMAIPTAGDVRAESRAKARERARERVKEKCVSSSAIPSSATTSGEAAITAASTMPVQSFVPSTSSNVHQLLPELFLLSGQLRQQFDDPHRVTDLSSMLSQPASSATLAPHLLPLSSHFFSAPPSSSESSFVYPGDVSSSFQFSVPPVYATNTPISPRGTLQSIFSINPANSSMQSHMSHVLPLNMTMGALQQAHVYGATLTSVREDGRDNNEAIRQRSAELGSPDLHQHSHIPMRIHGMELDSHVEETRISPSSMQTDFQ